MVKKFLGQMIKSYRNEHSLSIRDYAKLSGLSASYISMLERNKDGRGNPIAPTSDTLIKVANSMGITLTELSHMLDPTQILTVDSTKSIENVKEIELGRFLIPVVATVAAGEPIYSVEHVLEYIDWDKDPHGNIFGLKIQGDSMTPRIQNGDTIIVDREAAYSDGDIIVAAVNGNEGTCKRLKLYAEGLALVSLNPKYEPMYFSKEQVEELPVRIIGKVIENRQKF